MKTFISNQIMSDESEILTIICSADEKKLQLVETWYKNGTICLKEIKYCEDIKELQFRYDLTVKTKSTYSKLIYL